MAELLLAALTAAPSAMWVVTADGVLWCNDRARATPAAGDGRPPRVGAHDLDALARTVTSEEGRRQFRGPLGGPESGGQEVVAQLRRLDVGGAPATLVQLDPSTAGRDDVDSVDRAQLALLPPSLPLLPGMRLSGSYHQASRVGSAGGDWYDAVSLGQGRLALVISDAVGHGVPAAAAMSRLRGALRASAMRDPAPVDVLAALDQFAAGTGDVDGASIFYGLLDAASGALRYSAAGHPAPVLVRADGSSRPLDVVPRPPLGTVPGVVAVEQQAQLEPGETLVLFSDGVLSALGGPPAEGMRLLAEASHRAVVALDEDAAADVAETVAEMLRNRLDRPDDVAVLVAHRRSVQPGSLDIDLPALPPSLSGVRRTLGRWLATLGMGEQDRVGVLVAAGEACANSVEHAYPEGEPGVVHVHADVDPDGLLTVRVRDEGHWRTPDREPGDRGRGLLIMRQMVDSVLLEERETGTTVTLTVRLRRGADVDHDRVHTGSEDDAVVDRSGAVPVVRVSGSVDTLGAEQMRIRLLEASRGGTTRCRLDLAQVRLFSSAGVRVVFAVARIALAEGWRLQVDAPEGGSPRHVLLISGVPALVDLD